MSSTYDLPYAFQQKNNYIHLFEVGSDTNTYEAPTQSLTDGVKVEYSTCQAVFVDTHYNSEDSAPTETSYLNCRDSEIPAVLAFVKAQMTADPQLRLMYKDEFTRELLKAREGQLPEVRAFRPMYPYSF